MLKILISDKLSPAATEIFQRHGITADVRHGLTKEQLIEIIADYDGLAVRSETKVTRDVIERATRLKVIGRAGIGVDNVDVPAATARGIVVMNTPFGNSVTTAEHAVAMMMALIQAPRPPLSVRGAQLITGGRDEVRSIQQSWQPADDERS